jgi:hypothetical protein
MATLTHSDDGWYRYALEFARRGFWPVGEIETHGPHTAPADRIWGEALAVSDDGVCLTLSFLGPRGCRGYRDIRGLRFADSEDPGNRFAILPVGELSRKARVWLCSAEGRVRNRGGRT